MIDALYAVERNESAGQAVIAAFDAPVRFEAALAALAPAACDLVDDTQADFDQWSFRVALASVAEEVPGSLTALAMFDVTEALVATQCPDEYAKFGG